MNHISKPHLVDLLRIFDKRKFFLPRIRYASVRSKPELLNDLKQYFGTRLTPDNIFFLPLPSCPTGVPRIHYSRGDRKFYFDGKEIDAPAASRQVPRFEIQRGPVTLYWNQWNNLSQSPCPEAPACPPSTCKAVDALSEFRELELHDL